MPRSVWARKLSSFCCSGPQHRRVSSLGLRSVLGLASVARLCSGSAFGARPDSCTNPHVRSSLYWQLAETFSATSPVVSGAGVQAAAVKAAGSNMSALKFRYPDPTVIKASDEQTATVIMMHGLGDTAAGWSPVGRQLSSLLPHVKWVFPTAPTVRACLSTFIASFALQLRAVTVALGAGFEPQRVRMRI